MPKLYGGLLYRVTAFQAETTIGTAQEPPSQLHDLTNCGNTLANAVLSVQISVLQDTENSLSLPIRMCPALESSLPKRDNLVGPWLLRSMPGTPCLHGHAHNTCAHFWQSEA